MGIPSYFKHVVQKHRNILKKYSVSGNKKENMLIDNFYMDCNSVIYDCVRQLPKNCKDIESELIKLTCIKIEEYINMINPKKRVFVAFDGVAPVAKLEQQRNRRFKTQFVKQVLDNLGVDKEEIEWSTASITPGTHFMEKLAKSTNKYFKDKRFSKLIIFVSASDEPGEGEHKIYKYIRDNNHHQKESTAIYGLDADLIMLTLNHLRSADKLYLFRETPHFIRSFDKSLDPNETYVMDMPLMAECLTNELNDGKDIKDESQKQRMFDYIFICFLLGNDFMPHFPALNIRTNGIDRIMSAYKLTISESGNLTTKNKIIWKNVRTFIKKLADKEEEYIENEHGIREKQSKNIKYRRPRDNESKEELLFTNVPMLDRKKEVYINPYEKGWQKRYYKVLFDGEMCKEHIQKLCLNYLEGLEWTFKYYTTGCADWSWHYQYEYPPLLQDLINYIPYFDVELINNNNSEPLPPVVQLSYVLPSSMSELLPLKVRNKLISEYPEWYQDDYSFEWSYCKYFWECHAKLPNIDITKLKSILV